MTKKEKQERLEILAALMSGCASDEAYRIYDRRWSELVNLEPDGIKGTQIPE